MFWGYIGDNDYVYRPIVFPLAFQRRNVFVTSKVFHFNMSQAGMLKGSLAWERFVPTTAHVHEFGCRLVSKRNERKRMAQGTLSQKDRQVYCGFYGLNAKSIRALVDTEELNEVIRADVVHLVEDGEIAHAELIIELAAGVIDIEDTKTAIFDRLWNASRGPRTHVCFSDIDLNEHPSKLLIVGGFGEFNDQSGCLHGLWRITKFHVSKLLWQCGLFNR